MIRYKTNIIDALKANGFSTYKIRQEKIFGQATLQKFRQEELVSWDNINTLCTLLNCQPADILEYIPDEIPNAETVESFSEIEIGNGTHFKGNTKNLFQNLQESED